MRDESGDAFRGAMQDRADGIRENAEDRDAFEKQVQDPLAALGIIAVTLPNPLTGQEFIAKRDPPMEWAIKPLLPRGEVIEVNGGHGRLKSTLAMSWCFAVATGFDWGGYSVTKGKACFISMEDRERVLRSRTFAWIGGLDPKDRDKAARDLTLNFSVLAREQARGYAVTSIERGKVVRNEMAIRKIKEIARNHMLVVLETTARLHGGEEDNTGLIAFGLAMEEIATETGATIVIIRHQSKAAAQSQATDSYAGRGGGALADMSRGVFVITRPDVADPKERDLRPVVLTHAKATIGAPVPPMYWKPEVITLSNGDTPVYLRPMTKSEVATGLEAKITDVIADTFPEGIKRDELIRALPGMERGKARGVLDDMIKRGLVVEVKVETGKKGKPARVYRLPDWSISVVEGGK